MSKIRKLIVCLLVLGMASASAVMPSTALAKPRTKKEAKKEDAVFATKRGKKYHRADCRFIRNRETTSMNTEEAEAKGLAPCGRCIIAS